MCDDETDLTEEEIAEMWDKGTPVELKFSPQAAAAMSKLGDREIKILDTDPNPLACPNCDTVGEWIRDTEDPNKILCARDGTHIMTQVDDE